MEDYLAMKKRIRQLAPDVPLIEVLEPSDIEAFGGTVSLPGRFAADRHWEGLVYKPRVLVAGYLLSALRPVHIQQSNYAKLILSTIGSLSPQELVAATPSLERLKEFALQLVDLYRSVSALWLPLVYVETVGPVVDVG